MTEFDEKKFQDIFEKLYDEGKFSGVFLVAREDEIILEKAYGYSCKSYQVANTMDTKFNIGSLNKLITKIAILQLVQKGMLSLDDYVGEHLQEFPDEIRSKVKIQHLLEFTSGMEDYFNEKFQQSLGNLRTLDDFIPFFINDPLSFEPGEGNQYSNAGYVVLGKVIEAVSGMDYYDYVRENIYKPAGMSDSDHYEIDSITPNLAIGYTHQMPDDSIDPTKRRTNFFLIGSRGSSAGGGHSTAYDLLKLDRAIINEVLLDKEHSSRVFLPLSVEPGTKPRLVGLAGGAPGLCALYLKFFQAGYTVFVLSNYDPEDVEPATKEITNYFVPKDEQVKQVRMATKED